MVLRVDPEELESQARRIEGVARQFGADLDTARSEVDALDWDGRAREAYVAMFQEARTQFRDVEEQITTIATALRLAKDGLVDADEAIARSVRG